MPVSVMPDLSSNMHLDMYQREKGDFLYGLQWGDPENSEPLRYIRDHYLLPYINEEATVVEIGPGGGRWTRYMARAKTIYAVDYYQELLDELTGNFSNSNIVPIKNNGTDFPGIPDHSVDFVFSFDCFVHLDLPLIEAYLVNLPRVLKAQATVFIHYADKTKPLGASNKGFSENDPARMRALIERLGLYKIEEEDTGTMHHSSMVRLSVV